MSYFYKPYKTTLLKSLTMKDDYIGRIIDSMEKEKRHKFHKPKKYEKTIPLVPEPRKKVTRFCLWDLTAEEIESLMRTNREKIDSYEK